MSSAIEPAAGPQMFLGRQPVFDRRMHAVGYELLYRRGEQDSDPGTDGDLRTSQVVLTTFLELGLDNVVGTSLAFINATRTFLLERLALHLPPDRVVVEVLEDVVPDAAVVEAVTELRQRGYLVALDDFLLDSIAEPLVPLADIVKVDVARVSPRDLPNYVARLERKGLRLLAECVETLEQFSACAALGFEYFQGFFLARSSTLRCARRRRPFSQLSALRVLALLERHDVNLDELLEAVSSDPTLSYRLLTVINSAAFGLQRRIESLRQALVMLGLRRVHGWVTMMLLGGLSDRPPELLATALVRARMCEQLASRLGTGREPAHFTTGLLSLLDVMLEMPWQELVPHLPLSAEVLAAIVGHEGMMGALLEVVIHYERCEWDGVQWPGLDAADFQRTYLDAIAWSGRLTASPEARAVARAASS